MVTVEGSRTAKGTDVRPHTFDTYQNRFECITLDRTDDGILTIKFHAPGNPDGVVEYGNWPVSWRDLFIEWSFCYYDVAQDPDNEVVIITAAGDMFIGAEEFNPDEAGDTKDSRDKAIPFTTGAELVGKAPPGSPNDWDWLMNQCIANMQALLSIGVPVIGAINGPAFTHAEMALLSDIVICSENAEFQDQPHFLSGLFAPGDGVSVVWPTWLGLNRGRHFLLSGAKLSPQEAVDLGLVSEVVSRDKLMARAMEIAQELLKRPRLVRRYARQIMVREIKEKLMNHLPYGLALEGLGQAGRLLDSDGEPPTPFWRLPAQ